MDLLNNLAEIQASNELFIPLLGKSKTIPKSELFSPEARTDSNSFPRFESIDFGHFHFRPHSVFNYLDIYFDYPGKSCFKLMYAQLLKNPEIWIYVSIKKVAIIHFVRRNHLNVIISIRMRKQTGIPHLKKNQKDIPIQQLYLHPQSITKEINWFERNYKIARLLLKIFKIKHIEISYENLVSNINEFSRIESFLQLSSHQTDLISTYKKIINAKHQEIIENYSEIKNTLSSTKHRWMID
jgi:hypothetical protein